MNFEETKTVKSYFSRSLSSLLGFWLVLKPFRCCWCFFFDLSVRQLPFRKVPQFEAIGTLRNVSIILATMSHSSDHSQTTPGF